MNYHAHKHHKSSEAEFMDALKKLEESLESSDRSSSPESSDRLTPKKMPPKISPPHKPKQEFLLSALEDAAADIDRFMASKQLHADES